MSEKLVRVYIMGKQYDVPKGLTIMRAMEHAGYKLVRGTGCRGGFCGACGTVYRTEGDYKLKVGLACQTCVEDGMYLAQIPFFPANKTVYDIDKLKAVGETLLALYPESARCLSCNLCTKICPQSIEVLDYMSGIMRGDIAYVADISFDCIMCGLCASRCSADIPQYHVALLARRLYARYIAPAAKHLADRVKEIEDGKFDSEIDGLMKMNEKELEELYKKREIEKEN